MKPQMYATTECRIVPFEADAIPVCGVFDKGRPAPLVPLPPPADAIGLALGPFVRRRRDGGGRAVKALSGAGHSNSATKKPQ